MRGIALGFIEKATAVHPDQHGPFVRPILRCVDVKTLPRLFAVRDIDDRPQRQPCQLLLFVDQQCPGPGEHVGTELAAHPGNCRAKPDHLAAVSLPTDLKPRSVSRNTFANGDNSSSSSIRTPT